ncbi:MAG: protein translocase SEC61 complex subunit gamma [Candidatus Korarchaeota archaeon]
MGLRSFLVWSKRILQMSKKPDWSTFKRLFLVTLLGTGILGALGYVIKLLMMMLSTLFLQKPSGG